MDYIREELLRQQALLVILLTGQRPEPTEEPQERSRVSGEDAPAKVVGQFLGKKGIGAGQTFLIPEDPAAQTTALWAALSAGASERHDGEMAEAAGPAAGRTGGAATAETGERPVGSAAAENGEIRWVAQLRQAEESRPSDPAVLSRVFQRDARRYDGGFRLY